MIDFSTTNATSPGTLPSYNTLSEADALATSSHGLTAWAAASDAQKIKALQTASMRLDAAYRWQGSKYNLDAAGNPIVQEQEFPRLDVDGRRIDQDPDDAMSFVPVVPRNVKLAELFEANSLLDGQRAAAVAAQHDGLTGQEIGTARETYRAPVGSDGVPLLCIEADRLMCRYILRTGRLL